MNTIVLMQRELLRNGISNAGIRVLILGLAYGVAEEAYALGLKEGLERAERERTEFFGGPNFEAEGMDAMARHAGP